MNTPCLQYLVFLYFWHNFFLSFIFAGCCQSIWANQRCDRRKLLIWHRNDCRGLYNTYHSVSHPHTNKLCFYPIANDIDYNTETMLDKFGYKTAKLCTKLEKCHLQPFSIFLFCVAAQVENIFYVNINVQGGHG